MASYGTIYEFRFDDINGDDVDIFIAKKNYTGSVTRRALGRTPILKRERGGNILGTSLEIYAECKVDGEFAQLYTSSADEFRVEVYKRRNLLWTGFVSPELYSEPDIAPPYDVQIIATDGLGELKDHDYRFYGKATLRNHIQHALAPTSLQGDITLVSSLSWEDDTSANAPSSLLEMVTDLSHLEEESCYDVLQSILTSLNACITQQDGGWMVIRESDLYLNAFKLPTALFGSMTKAQWWPVGNMSIDIIPAKKEVSVVHENQYRENILPPISMGVAAGWEIGVGCYYSSAEGGWIVPPETGLSYRIDARQYPLQSNLLLRIKARCLAIEGRDDVSKLSVYMERDYAGSTTYLIRDYSPQEDRVIMRWHDEMMGYVYAWDAPFVEQDTEPAVHDLEILVPLSGETLAESLNIVIGNPYPSPYLLCIYSIELTQAEQTPGSRLTAIIANGAREKMNESKVILSSSANPSLPDLQYGILRLDGGVVEWHTPATTAPDLLSFAARDLAMQVALPRMRYRGKLNVPSLAFPRIPVLFQRDDTYYFLNTYSFDLLNSELEVELISIPNAQVQIESETVTELPSSGSGSAPSSGGSTGGGGGSDIVVDSAMSSSSTNPVQNKVVKKYVDDAETRAKKYTDDKIAQIETGGGSITVDTEMSDSSENAVQNKVIKAYVDKHPQYEVIEDIEVPDLPEGPQGSVDLTGYATEQWVENKGYATRSWVNGQEYATEQWVANQGFVDKTYVGSQINAYSSNTYALISALEERITALEKMLEGVDGASGCYFIPTGVTFADDIVSVSYDKVGVMVEPLTVKTIAKITGSIPCAKESTVSSSLANLVTMFNENDLSIVYEPGNQYTIEITVVTSDSNGTTTKKESFTFTA
jgi:hypothetical protein